MDVGRVVVVEREFLECGTSLEGVVTDVGDIFRHFDGLQVGAILEHPVVDGGESWWQRDVGQGLAPFECVSVEIFSTGEIL